MVCAHAADISLNIENLVQLANYSQSAVWSYCCAHVADNQSIYRL